MDAFEAAHNGDLAAVRAALDAGSDAGAVDEQGWSLLHRAAMGAEADPVRAAAVLAALLAAAAGIEPPAPDEEAPAPERKLSRAQWREARKRIGKVLDGLDAAGFVALAGAGTTQSDGFDDCSDAAERRGHGPDGLVGFCYYTRQDAERARETGRLFLAFWGAPDGSTRKMKQAGELVAGAFREAGFRVDWDGTGDRRPSVHLAG
ncbi:ankyrin repeat domain-containing protein [Streptomyces sp. P8-A8]|uniref:ankyrin repeat domain-containing protein n=1 Tax=Streptomyces sp. P8-A8 TaxID=3029759 RepID=UPI0036D8A11D